MATHLSEVLGGEAILVLLVWHSAAREQELDNIGMAVCRSKVEGGRACRRVSVEHGPACVMPDRVLERRNMIWRHALLTCCSDGRGILVVLVVTVSSGKTRRVDVGATLNEHADNGDATTGTGGVQWETTVQERVDRLAVRQGVVHEADIAAGCCRVQFEVWDWWRCGRGDVSSPSQDKVERTFAQGRPRGRWERSEKCGVVDDKVGEHVSMGTHRMENNREHRRKDEVRGST